MTRQSRRQVIPGLVAGILLAFLASSVRVVEASGLALKDNAWQQLELGSSSRYLTPEFKVTATPVADPNPRTRSYSGLVSGGGKVFWFGGGHNSYPGNDVETFEPALLSWQQSYKPEVCPYDPSAPCYDIYNGWGTSIATPLGRPYIQHTYQAYAWDPSRNSVVTVLNSGTWAYNVTSREWRALAGRYAGGTYSPMASAGLTHLMAYDTTIQALQVVISGGTERGIYAFDKQTSRWVKRGAPPEGGWATLYSTYAPDRGVHFVYATSNWSHGWWRYEASTGTWTALPKPSLVPDSFDYDTLNRVVVGVKHSGGVFRVVLFDPDAGQWRAVETAGTVPAQPHGLTGTPMAWRYVPSLNAFVFVEGNRGTIAGGTTKTWVYRYRNVGSGDVASVPLPEPEPAPTSEPSPTSEPAPAPSTAPQTSSPTSSAQAVSSLTLINAITNEPIAGFNPIPTGATLDLAKLPTRKLNIRANTSPTTVGSVKFGLDSTTSYRIENTAPYALAGDKNGDYAAWTPRLGTRTVAATPFTGSKASGTAGTALRISFTVTDGTTPTTTTPTTSNTAPVVNAGPDQTISAAGAAVTLAGTAKDDGKPEPATLTTRWSKVSGPGTVAFGSSDTLSTTATFSAAGAYALRLTASDGVLSAYDDVAVTVDTNSTTHSVASFSLLDASTGRPIAGFDPLPEGAALDLATLPTTLALRANTSPAVVGSVRFGYNGNTSYRVENSAPYSLSGDEAGQYSPWSPRAGTHQVSATPYSGTSASGSKGTPLTRNFTVIASTTTTAPTAPTPPPATEPESSPPSSWSPNSRCAELAKLLGSGLLSCWDFESPEQVKNRDERDSGAQYVSTITHDTTRAASGNGSMKFEVLSVRTAKERNPGISDAQAHNIAIESGNPSWGRNFTIDRSWLAGPGKEFWLQWREFVNDAFLGNWGGDGPKNIIIGKGDRYYTDSTGKLVHLRAGGCTSMEIVMTNGFWRGFPQSYHSCGVKDGKYEGHGLRQGTSDFLMQSGNLGTWDEAKKLWVGGCRYQNTAGCRRYESGRWVTYTVHVKVGTWYQNDSNYKHDSTIRIWLDDKLVTERAPEQKHPRVGAPTQAECMARPTSAPLATDCLTGYDLVRGFETSDLPMSLTDVGGEYGKFYLLPLSWGRQSLSASDPILCCHAPAIRWVDDVVVSRVPIPLP